ncbi:hypothetical protein K504DRAFT_490833 [Pleomassaria siparia CBS 279.74]|uniref:JmjC domain-containing protein n=1 Tax=Pleomassaria siparia CBS 279.74 TaxID=1314801 RepID=A0A6G1KA12_9PLEO|nr:hypothetical protein K504DRAFT_490833 [Pleomassaria siparia CBS 279.74]
MPAARPRASFEPIPPDFDVRTFVETADNFQYVDRISYEMIATNGIDAFEKLVLLHVIIGGKPLVIDGFEEVLDPWTFTPSWLRDNHGDKVENACNLTTKENIPLTLRHYLKHMGKLTDQFFNGSERYRDKTRQRIYLKDIDCPQVWQDKLKDHIPAGLFYLNESTGEIGGPGALDHAGSRKGRGIARAGDLMSSLPPEMRAENLMCYIGHEGTYTPSHREMCASLGQNIMVNASTLVSEEGKPERPGSSLWFMTETKDRQVVSEYWLSILGHDIEVENHFAQLIAWKKAPFKTYVVEQRAGDFILIPPLAPHQVWNRGTRTMKIAWNRTTVETLELALNEALPNSRVVCRDEQYKNKAIVYYTLLKYSGLIKSARAQVELGGEQAEAIQRSSKIRHVQRDFKRLFDLYKSILLSEMFAPDSREHAEFVAYDSNVTCAYCRCNIFNRFLTCKTCKHMFSSEIEEPYDVCMDCYCMGRSCGCQSQYTWVEQWKWKDLIHKYEEWRAQIIDIDGHMTEKTPLPLQEERRYLGKKTLAQVCQEQLKVRPFVDIRNPEPEDEGSDGEEIVVNDDGTVKKMAKKKSKQWLSKHKSCHFCLNRHPRWKMAFCSNCDLAYCYGTLFRAHDLMPLTIMENPNWKCPHCTRTCNTGACRRDPRQHPYEPKGTLLGHDTKKVADVRSVECLVDFGVSNLNWIREEDGPGQRIGPLQRRRHEAERAKLADPSLDDRYMDDDDHDQETRNAIAYSPVEDSNTGPDESLLQNGEGSSAQNHTSLHQEYVDPSSILHGAYQPDTGMQENEFGSYYPDPDLNGDLPRLGKKRGRDDEDDEEGLSRRKRQAKRARKKKAEEAMQPAPPKNASGKEYQKEVQRKLLEEAKKEDRYNLVAARMKGKSRIIKLFLHSDHLEKIRRRPAAQREKAAHPEPESTVEDTGSILQSDVLPSTKRANAAAKQSKVPTTFRYRVEEDDSYTSRKRDRENNGTGKTGKTGRQSRASRRYEEVTLDSEEDFDDDNNRTEYAGPGGGGGRPPKARASNWLARKNEGEDDLPTELPKDFRDGTLNHNRERNSARDAERRKTMPAKSKAQIRPPGIPSRKSTGNIEEDEDGIHEDEDGIHGVEDGIHEDDDQAEAALLLAQSAAAALEISKKTELEISKKAEEEISKKAEQERIRAQQAAKEAEENMRAKLEIAEWAEGSENESLNGLIDNLAADDEPLYQEKQLSPKLGHSGPPQSENSLLSRPGISGKKIKIVSASAQHEGVTSGNSTPVPPDRPPVNGSTDSRILELSDSDSEDEIPAKAPASAKAALGRPLGRPPGRPSAIVPTRVGLNVGKRGRGRPRKSM